MLRNFLAVVLIKKARFYNFTMLQKKQKRVYSSRQSIIENKTVLENGSWNIGINALKI